MSVGEIRQRIEAITPKEHYGMILFIRKYTISKDMAEDFLQDAYLEAMLKAEQIKNPDRLISWLKTVAKRKALKHMSQYHGMMKRCALYSANFPSVAGYDRVSYIVAADIFSRVMKRFPYYYKRVFLYRHLYHMPYAEIALTLNITECAARQAHSRVMRAFRNEALRHDQTVIE